MRSYAKYLRLDDDVFGSFVIILQAIDHAWIDWYAKQNKAEK